MKRKNLIPYIAAMLLFAFYAFAANWSLLLGENLMKWDIWDAEYPMQMLISDALASHTLPLWNPLMHYGTPNYAITGSPIWYPFTLLLALKGYTPSTIALSYAMHIAIGGYGMFLLTGYELRQHEEIGTAGRLGACAAAGLLYCGSGLFLSNAQHIMIIISAAWIPYVFYFVRRCLTENSLLCGMAAGACAGLIFLGGYPEMFFDLFLYLALYTLYFSFRTADGGSKKYAWIPKAAAVYVSVCLFTVLAAAVSLLPFLCNMGLITRGSGLGQIPLGYSLTAWLSAIFPAATSFISGGEISMVNYYVGMIVLLLFPMCFSKGSASQRIYPLLVAGALFMCWGGNSFFYALLYRFVPMYDQFRFPTLNRVFLTLFLILSAAPALGQLMNASVDASLCRRARILFTIVLSAAVLSGLTGNLLADSSVLSADRCLAFSTSAFMVSFIAALWLAALSAVRDQWLKGGLVPAVFVILTAAELWIHASAETPVTIARYEPLEYSYSQQTRAAVDSAFIQNANRDRRTDFKEQERSTSGLNSIDLLFNKTFDEEGYVSFRMKSTDDFLSTYVRTIMEQNPVVYFTNDVVTPADMPYEQWSRSCDPAPGQIYAAAAPQDGAAVISLPQPELSGSAELAFEDQSGTAVIWGPISATEQMTGRIRLFYPDVSEEKLPLTLTFTERGGEPEEYAGSFTVYDGPDGRYVDVYFPEVNQDYDQVRIFSASGLPASASLVTTARSTKDAHVTVSEFGFNDIRMEADAPAAGYVTLLQAKHDGWTAYVDGRETEIALIDNCFMGIAVEPGSHSIELRFRPAEFYVGLALSALYFAALALVLCVHLLPRKTLFHTAIRPGRTNIG